MFVRPLFLVKGLWDSFWGSNVRVIVGDYKLECLWGELRAKERVHPQIHFKIYGRKFGCPRKFSRKYRVREHLPG